MDVDAVATVTEHLANLAEDVVAAEEEKDLLSTTTISHLFEPKLLAPPA